jgi:hypothetical protein
MKSIGQIQEKGRLAVIAENSLEVPTLEQQQQVLDALLYDGLCKIYNIMQTGSFDEQIKSFNSMISHSRLVEQRRMNTAEEDQMIMDDPNLVLVEQDE